MHGAVARTADVHALEDVVVDIPDALVAVHDDADAVEGIAPVHAVLRRGEAGVGDRGQPLRKVEVAADPLAAVDLLEDVQLAAGRPTPRAHRPERRPRALLLREFGADLAASVLGLDLAVARDRAGCEGLAVARLASAFKLERAVRDDVVTTARVPLQLVVALLGVVVPVLAAADAERAPRELVAPGEVVVDLEVLLKRVRRRAVDNGLRGDGRRRRFGGRRLVERPARDVVRDAGELVDAIPAPRREVRLGGELRRHRRRVRPVDGVGLQQHRAVESAEGDGVGAGERTRGAKSEGEEQAKGLCFHGNCPPLIKLVQAIWMEPTG